MNSKYLIIGNPRSGSSALSVAFDMQNYFGEITTLEHYQIQDHMPGCETLEQRINFLRYKDAWTVKWFFIDRNVNEYKNQFCEVIGMADQVYYIKRDVVDQIISYNTAIQTNVFNLWKDQPMITGWRYKNWKGINETSVKWVIDEDLIRTWYQSVTDWEKYLTNFDQIVTINYTDDFMKQHQFNENIVKLDSVAEYTQKVHIDYDQEKIRENIKKIIKNT